jgi:putative heme iron utilization protein
MLAKFYHQDRWDRLDREFSALELLGRHGLASVPRAFLRSEAWSYGVYSFEPGRAKRAVEFERADLMAVAAFAADLNGVVPSTTGRDITTAADASFSVAEQLQVIDGRLRAFETFAVGHDA